MQILTFTVWLYYFTRRENGVSSCEYPDYYNLFTLLWRINLALYLPTAFSLTQHPAITCRLSYKVRVCSFLVCSFWGTDGEKEKAVMQRKRYENTNLYKKGYQGTFITWSNNLFESLTSFICGINALYTFCLLLFCFRKKKKVQKFHETCDVYFHRSFFSQDEVEIACPV